MVWFVFCGFARGDGAITGKDFSGHTGDHRTTAFEFNFGDQAEFSIGALKRADRHPEVVGVSQRAFAVSHFQ